MFSLIITIISIALVAALAIATLYYGGSAFSQGSAKAVADTVIAQAQQIAGANTLFANDNGGTYTTSPAALVSGNYLTVSPVAPVGAFSAGTTNSPAYVLPSASANSVSITLGNANVCLAINKASGTTSATQTVPNVAASANAQFDCFGSGTSYAFSFKG